VPLRFSQLSRGNSFGVDDRSRPPWPVLVQAAYLIATGIWPLVHYRSFEAVTGPKTDAWIVQTVGAAAVVLGLAAATSDRERSLVLSVGSTLAFGVTEVAPALRGRIRKVYLLDAGFQSALTFLAMRSASRQCTPIPEEPHWK
jgi:hypothetical protein